MERPSLDLRKYLSFVHLLRPMRFLTGVGSCLCTTENVGSITAHDSIILSTLGEFSGIILWSEYPVVCQLELCQFYDGVR